LFQRLRRVDHLGCTG